MYSEASDYARKSYGGNTQINYKEWKIGDSIAASNSQKSTNNNSRKINKSSAIVRGLKTNRDQKKPIVELKGIKMTPINVSTRQLLQNNNQIPRI